MFDLKIPAAQFLPPCLFMLNRGRGRTAKNPEKKYIYIYVNVIKHFVLSFTFFWKFSGRSKCFIEPKIIRKWKRYLLERGVVVVTRSKIRSKKNCME